MRPGIDLLLPELVLADGAMGTYYTQQGAGAGLACEEANLEKPALIQAIHNEYIKAGARLIRTNTFGAIALSEGRPADYLTRIIRAGYQLAAGLAGGDVFVAADFGPAYNLNQADYLESGWLAAQEFAACGADIFLFETFADPAEFRPLAKRIKKELPGAVIIASFALSPDGLTRKGISLASLSDCMEQAEEIDIWGFNCGIGPTHLARQAARLPDQGKPLMFLPNSGYPRLENQRLVYGTDPAYFASVLAGLAGGRTRLLGGCCGTTPQHISALGQLLAKDPQSRLTQPARPAQPRPRTEKTSHLLAEKLAKAEFTLVAELNPPADSELTPFLTAASQLRDAGIDLVTVTDSPLARPKMDSLMAAARIQRDLDLPALPHLTCRDRNSNSLRAGLLALHSEGVRQVLAVTGDAIPESDRGYVKPVFNFSSLGLLELISQMNKEEFAHEPFLAAAAADPGSRNAKAEFTRLCRKQEAGAALFLTQPVYSEAALPLIRRMREAGMKVFSGLMPLVSYRNARFLSQEVPGIRIPAEILARFSPDQDKAEAVNTGLEITRQLAQMLRPEVDGFYLVTPFNRSSLLARLLAENPAVFS